MTIKQIIEGYLTKFNKETGKIDSYLNSYNLDSYLTIDYNNFKEYCTEQYQETKDNIICDKLLTEPNQVITLFKNTIKEIAAIQEKQIQIVDLRFINIPGIELNGLFSEYDGNFVTVEGIIRKTSSIKGREYQVSYTCKNCGKEKIIFLDDPYQYQIIKPGICEYCRDTHFKLTTKNDKNTKDYTSLLKKGNETSAINIPKMLDYQYMELQSLTGSIYGGTNVSTIKLRVENNLCETVKAGTKIKATGIIKAIPSENKNQVTPSFDFEMFVNNIENIEKDITELEITKDDLKQIKELSEKPNLIDLIANTVGSNLAEMKRIKEAIVLQLFGGSKTDNNDRNGRIHILLIGDPGIGKSQLLNSAVNLIPRAKYINGVSTTSAGLTATAVQGTNNQWNLEAGALVLCNNGLLAIDEFTKMNDTDLNGLLEAMENGRVSISKAGITGNLPANTTILAATNPRNGSFNKYKPLIDQINIDAPLFSRFDLIFLLEDKPNRERDSKIANAILTKDNGNNNNTKRIPLNLLRKYIGYARQNYNPGLTDEAKEVLQEWYINLRSESTEENIPITARELEAIKRLAEANAKMHLRNQVTISDVKTAIDLKGISIYQIGLDPTTGKIDSNVVVGEKSKNQVNDIEFIKEQLQELRNDYETREIEIDDFIRIALTEYEPTLNGTSITEERIKQALNYLKQEKAVTIQNDVLKF